MTDMTVARTILDQLGGARFVAMTGAREFVGSADSLTFKIGVNPKRVTQVRVTLTPHTIAAVPSGMGTSGSPCWATGPYRSTASGVTGSRSWSLTTSTTVSAGSTASTISPKQASVAR